MVGLGWDGVLRAKPRSGGDPPRIPKPRASAATPQYPRAGRLPPIRRLGVSSCRSRFALLS